MKGKVSFIGPDAPKDVLEFEIPSSEKPEIPKGYALIRRSGRNLLLERVLDGGKLELSWIWNPRPQSRPPGGVRCPKCGKTFVNANGARIHDAVIHGTPRGLAR